MDSRTELNDELPGASAREEALLSRVSLLESAYMELEKELARAQKENGCATARPRSSQRRFPRSAARLSRSPAVEEEPDETGLVLVAARLAREGYTRDEVARFLTENFCVTDVDTTVETAFAAPGEPEPAGA